jgi:hypothetical protein
VIGYRGIEVKETKQISPLTSLRVTTMNTVLRCTVDMLQCSQELNADMRREAVQVFPKVDPHYQKYLSWSKAFIQCAAAPGMALQQISTVDPLEACTQSFAIRLCCE